MYPTISQYIETVTKPDGFFRTLTPQCELNIYGDPKFYAGGNAVIFKIRAGGKLHALKCYTKNRASLKRLYESIRLLGCSLLYKTCYLPQEIYVSNSGGGAWYDATLTEWAEGHTLEFAIRKAIHDGNSSAMAILAGNFDALVCELLDAPWAHGDLKPENIIVSPAGRMRLIDYDAMFVPSIPGSFTEEAGTPFYQHPLRSNRHFDRHIDDYPAALISATLHALSLDGGLHRKYGNSDYFLFSPADILNGRSAGYRAAIEMASVRGEALLYGLLRSLSSPVPRIEGLKDILEAMERMRKVACGRGNACVEVSESVDGKAGADSPVRGKDNACMDSPACGSVDAEADSSLFAPRRAATPFAREGRWGYMAEDGSVALPPVLDFALEFHEDTAIVNIGGRNHLLSRDGNCVSGASYDNRRQSQIVMQ